MSLDGIVFFGNFLNEYAPVFGILIALFSGIWAIVKFRKYLQERTLEAKDKRFIAYHEIIKIFSQGDALDLNGTHTKLDRQIACVYELRNFPEYFDVSLRILKGWKESLNDNRQQFQRLYDEIEFAISFIEKTKK
jgi:hypothetical protein